MGHTKAVDTAQVHAVEPPSVAPPETSAAEPPEGALVEQTAASACVGDLVTPGPDIALVTNSAPMAETRKETSNADTSSVAPIPPKPVLKLKPSKTKPKIGAPVARANGDANKELEALLSPDAESRAAPTRILLPTRTCYWASWWTKSEWTPNLWARIYEAPRGREGIELTARRVVSSRMASHVRVARRSLPPPGQTASKESLLFK
jgi:hypothetical protein